MKDSPNILLIVMDCARPDHLSCYGYDRDTTPNVDKIAREGVVYENATSSAVWSLPSHASLFTGVYPSKHGAHGQHYRLSAPYVTLAELLSSCGYRTVCATANSWISPATGLTRGFESVLTTRLYRIPRWRAIWRRLPPFLKRIVRELLYNLRYDDGARQVNTMIKEWITHHCAAEQERPFFLFVNYIEPHQRYRAPQPYRFMYLPDGVKPREALRVKQDPLRYVAGELELGARDFAILSALYDGEIRYLDSRLQELFSLLEEQGILDNTLLIITSDHGENIGDHKLMGHLFCLYDTLMRVPLIVRYPKVFPPGQRVAAQVQLLDIYPTIMDILGIEAKDIEKELQGRTLAFPGIEQRPRPYVVAEYMTPTDVLRFSTLTKGYHALGKEYYSRELRAVRTESWKYIWASDGNHELYNLADDPGELRNVIDQYPEIAGEMQKTLDEWSASFSSSRFDEQVELDEATKERLRGLGYIP